VDGSSHNWHARVTVRCGVRGYRRPRGRRVEPHPGWGVRGSRRRPPPRAPVRRCARMSHNTLLVFEVTILVLAIFLGFEVISKVPTMLHTPLMSGTNAIHGIV